MSLRSYSSIGPVLCTVTAVAFAADPSKPDATVKKPAAESRITSSMHVNPVAPTPLTRQELNQLSFAAGRIMKHVAQARDDLRDQKPDQAAAQIDQGLKLIEIINHTLPHFKVKTEIKSGDLVYCDEEEAKPRYVTLFDELERHDIISPIAQAKREFQHKHRPHVHGDTTAKDAPGAVAVTHVDVRHSSARLDTVLARQMLSRAKQELSTGKTQDADEALLTLQSGGVLFEFEEAEMPLEEAADNLKLAEVEMKEGRTSEAKAALHIAIDQLKRYEKLVGDTRSTEVKALHQEISKLTAILEKGPPSEEEIKKMSAQIGEWWQSATKWFKSQTK